VFFSEGMKLLFPEFITVSEMEKFCSPLLMTLLVSPVFTRINIRIPDWLEDNNHPKKPWINTKTALTSKSAPTPKRTFSGEIDIEEYERSRRDMLHRPHVKVFTPIILENIKCNLEGEGNCRHKN